MPTYDYLCSECGHRFEKFQSITAGVLKKCPECGKMSLQRLIGTGSGIIFKGSGFYETDYRKKESSGAGKPASTTETQSKTSDKKETKSTDTKPVEKKTETKTSDKKQ